MLAGTSLLGCERSSKKPSTAAPAKQAAAATPAAEPSEPLGSELQTSDKQEFEEAAGLAYAEVMLGGAKPDDTVPMIVAIHGLGDGPHSFGRLFANFPEPARLILPRGLDDYEAGGWSWFPLRARDPDVDELAKGVDRSAKTIAKGVAELQNKRKTVGKPIVTGFSQGGILTFELAVHHPDVVGVAIAVGGWLPPPRWPKKKPEDTALPRIVALHGTADNAVEYEPTVKAVEQLKELGYAVELKAYEGVRHVITPAIQRDLLDELADAVKAAKPSE